MSQVYNIMLVNYNLFGWIRLCEKESSLYSAFRYKNEKSDEQHKIGGSFRSLHVQGIHKE